MCVLAKTETKWQKLDNLSKNDGKDIGDVVCHEIWWWGQWIKPLSTLILYSDWNGWNSIYWYICFASDLLS